MLTEMRFFVPNVEVEAKAASPDGEEEKKGSDEEEEEQVTAAQMLNERIIKAAGIGEFAGEMIATLPELPMIIPRGKYSFDLYSTFVKLHGRTNDYKILYKDISKCFLLPKPDGIHMAYLLQLKTPLR
jgi:structure-specific recognition protein 1